MATWLLIIAFFTLVPHSLIADEPAPDAPLQFRRVLVPKERIQDVPRGTDRYVPKPAAEFDALVKSLAGQNRDSAPHDTFAKSTYTATWDGETLQGRLLAETGPIASPRRLPLSPLSLVLSEMRWADRDTPPIVATGGDGVLTLLVERAGRFEAAWSALGQRPPKGGVEFDLRLPPAPLKQLQIELPAGWALASSVGTVAAEVTDATRAGRWIVELGGLDRTTLSIFRRDTIAQSRRLPLVRTSTSYEFTGRGLNVASLWRLEAHDEPLREVSLVLDPGLQLIDAQYGETSLDWSAEAEANGGSTRVALRLPTPIRGTARPLRLEAVASAALDRTDALPRLHPVGLAWQEGSVSTRVPEPFVIEQFEPIQCRQVRTSPLPEPLLGESIELQSFAADATVRWRIGRTTARLRVDQGTSVTLLSGTTTAQIILSGRVDYGERFVINANVVPGWTIEAVESIPAGRISDWTLEPQGSNSALQLAVRLRDPVTPTEPVRLVVSARGAGQAAGTRLRSTELLPLKLPRTTVESHLFAVATASQWRARLDDDYTLVRLARDSLTEPERELLRTFADAQIVRLDEHDQLWSLRIEPRRSGASAQIELAATVDDTRLHESYTLRVQAAIEPVDRLLVHFTHSRVEPPQWRVPGNEATEFRVRRLSAEQQTSLDLPVAGETWEIVFPQPRHESFTLRAQRRTPLAAESPLSLAVLPELNDQHGTLAIHAAADVPLAIEQQRLEMSYPRRDRERDDALRQSFVYDPRRTLAGDLGPTIRVRREITQPALHSAVITRADHDVLIEPAGVVRRRVTWTVQHSGRTQITLTVPDAPTRITELRVNDELLTIDVGEPECFIPLANGGGSSIVAITLEEPLDEFRWFTQWSWQPLSIDVPILSQNATLWLAPGYRLLGDQPVEQDWRQDVAQRWFGWFLRDADQPRFQPTQQNAWRELLAGANITWQQSADAALAHLGTLGETPEGREPSRLWSAWQNQLTASGKQLWVRDALPQMTPQSIEPPGNATPWLSAAERGRRWLQSRSLALVVTPVALAVLPQVEALRDDEGLRPLDHGTLYTLRHTQTWPDLVVRHDRLRPIADSPVQTSTAPSPSTLEALGRRATNLPRLDAARPLTIVHQSVVTATVWTLFLIVTALLIAILRRNPSWHTLVTAGIAAFALVLPTACIPWAAALSTAVMASAVVRMSRVWRQAERRRSESPSRMSSRLATRTALFFLAMLFSSPASSQPLALPAQGDPVARILVPLDDQGKSTGTYLVPDRLYAELTRRLQAMRQASDDWYLTGATYHLHYGLNADDNTLELVELRVTYQLHVATPGVELRLPLSFEPAESIDEIEGVLGGSEITLRRLGPGKPWIGTCLESGELELSFSIEPRTIETDERRHFALGIPPVNNARVEVTLPANNSGVEIPGALGAWEHAADHRSSTLTLGALSSLNVQWPKHAQRQSSSTLDINELAWLRIRPGSVSAELTLRVRVASGVCRAVPLIVDPYWRLVPGKDDRLIANVETRAVDPAQPDAPRPVVVHLREATTEPFDLRLSFLQVGASGIGLVRLPPLASAGGRTTRRWLALSVDSALDHEFESPDAVVVAVEDFTEQWGAAGALPQLVLDRSSGESPVQITTRPKESRVEVAQDTSLAVTRSGVQVRYDAKLTISNAVTFQHRLALPPEVAIEHVSVLEDGEQRVARWSQASDGGVIVFLNGPASGMQEISLRGFLPLPTSSVVAVPRIALQGAVTTDAVVRVTRDPSVLVTPEQIQGLDDVDSPRSVPSGSRNVAQWQVASERGTAQLHVRPNDPRTNAMQLTTLRWDGKQWLAEVEVLASVEQGLLDRLRLETPRSWAGPFTLSPPLDYELLELPEQSHQLLTITPTEASSELLRVTISGPLKLSEGQLAHWPGARPLVTGNVERYLRLPTSWGNRSIAWDTEGLRQATLPEVIAPGLDAAAYETYRVTAGTVSAQLRQTHERDALAKLPLVEVRYALDASGQISGSVQFVVDPGGSKLLPLEVPEGCELVQVSVDGLAQTPRLSDNRCLIPLLGDLPQSVLVRFQTLLEQDPRYVRRGHVRAPMVTGLPTTQTVWIDESAQGAWRTVVDDRAQSDESRLALLRWQIWLGLYEQAEQNSAVHSLEEWNSWSAQHWQLLQELQAEVDLRRAQWRGLGLSTLEDNYQTLQRRSQRLAETRTDKANASADRVASRQHDLRVTGAPPRMVLLSGSVGAIEIERTDRSSASLVWRVLLALTLIITLSTSVMQPQLIKLPLDVLPRAAHVLSVLVGVAWWLWLAPSWFGWVVILASLLLSLRSGLRTTTESHSAIARLPVATR